MLLVRTDERATMAGTKEEVLDLTSRRCGVGTATVKISLGGELGEQRNGLTLRERARGRWRRGFVVEMNRLHRCGLGGLGSSLGHFIWRTNERK